MHRRVTHAVSGTGPSEQAGYAILFIFGNDRLIGATTTDRSLQYRSGIYDG
jgi:hypothetical protein